jgi:hypothetical protein
MARADKPATTMLDHFAGGLARTGDISRAAATLGQSRAWGLTKFREICEQLDVPVDPADEVCIDQMAG